MRSGRRRIKYQCTAHQFVLGVKIVIHFSAPFTGRAYWEKLIVLTSRIIQLQSFAYWWHCAINPFIREIKNFRMGDWFDLL
jgi:hypothetical protein